MIDFNNLTVGLWFCLSTHVFWANSDSSSKHIKIRKLKTPHVYKTQTALFPSIFFFFFIIHFSPQTSSGQSDWGATAAGWWNEGSWQNQTGGPALTLTSRLLSAQRGQRHKTAFLRRSISSAAQAGGLGERAAYGGGGGIPPPALSADDTFTLCKSSNNIWNP